MYHLAGCHCLTDLPDNWTLTTDQAYVDACARCEIRIVLLNAEAHARIKALLRFDRRDKGSHGRAMTTWLTMHTYLLATA